MSQRPSRFAFVLFASSFALAWACDDGANQGGDGGAAGSDGSGGDGESGGASASGGSGSGSGSGSTDGGGGTGGSSEPAEICHDFGGPTPTCAPFPPECGNFDDFQGALFGAAGPDTLNELSTRPLTVYFGLEGDDSLRGYGLGSCLVGGEGADTIEFQRDSEVPTANVGIGGPGVDVWVIEHPPAPPLLTDVSVDEEIQFRSIGTFEPTFIEFIDGYSGVEAKAATTYVVYDPESGKIWFDEDAAGATETPVHFATVVNHASVALTTANFVIAD